MKFLINDNRARTDRLTKKKDQLRSEIAGLKKENKQATTRRDEIANNEVETEISRTARPDQRRAIQPQ